MRKFLVIETFFNKNEQNFYYLMLPDFNDDGFYRSILSFGAFFSSTRNPHANVTEVRQFSGHAPYEIKHYEHLFKFNKVDPDKFQTFKSIWEFYDFIGYNRKTRKYNSGEVLKVWVDGEGYKIPKKRKK